MDSILDTDNARVAFLNAHNFAKDVFYKRLVIVAHLHSKGNQGSIKSYSLGEKLKAAEMFNSQGLLWTQRTRCHDIYIYIYIIIQILVEC